MQHHGFLAILADSGLLKAFMDIVCMLFCAFEECRIALMCMVIQLSSASLILWTFFELEEFLFGFKVLGSSTESDSSVCIRMYDLYT